MVKFFECLLLLLFIERFAMPAILIFEEGDAFALDCLGNNQRGRAIWLRRLSKRSVDLIIVVPINDNGIPAKCLGAGLINGSVPTMHSFTALPQAVAVEDAHQVVQFVVRGVIERLPNRSLGHLAITKEHPDMIGKLIQ